MRYCKRNRERDEDVFLGNKMMKFKNIKVCSKKRYFYKGDGEVWKSLGIYATK